MKRVIQLISATFLFIGRLAGQDNTIDGAWQSKKGDDETILICQKGYVVITEYNPVNTAFYYSGGGSYNVIKDRLIVSIEFTTNKTELRQAGKKAQLPYSRSDDHLSVTKDDSVNILFDRLDNGQGTLAGVWKLAGQQDGLKDLLILSAGRFQRMHFDTRTKELLKSYGGLYDYSDGKYIEHINFYRKHPEKIGKSLSFAVEISKNGMTIKGKNETGDLFEEKWIR